MKQEHQKVVVITGGSAGFGFALALEFSQQGATVVILSRDPGKLAAVVASADQTLVGIAADVTSDASVTEAVEEIRRRFGRIDVWVNNVGKSTRTAFKDCDLATYQDLMRVNFDSAVRCSLAALPLLEQSSGSLVNIGSLASKTGWRHVAPYATSKHALAAFSHQFRLEGPTNVHCLLVCPGPIRRIDAGSRYNSQAKGLDAAAQQPGAGVKLKGILPEKLARRVVRAVEKRKRELVVPGYTRILFALLALSPALGDWLLGRASK